MNILLIEDDRDIADLIAYHLKQERYSVQLCSTGSEGLKAARHDRPELIILDLMLPDMSGLEICRALKADAHTKNIPIVMLTAKSDEIDRVVGFEMGADDYLTKPFSPRELILRIKAIVRRAQSSELHVQGAQTVGVLTLDSEKFYMAVEGKEVKLTALEFRLLQYLIATRGRIATRDVLLDQVWGYDAALTTRTVDTHVKRLREKLGVAGDYIETIRSVGYRFKEKIS
ncbi:MAG: response regulator transcription factor [Deltaproteobacteria bacterium]|nr:response regulator transcription factor [Deltaproteobacteria bacterium]